MVTIFFSMSGEGRGHATRVSAVVEQLRRDHKIVLFASAQAFDLLVARYPAVSNVEVRRIPGLQFSYRNGRLDYFRSLWQSVPFIRRMGNHIAQLQRAIEDSQPDLIVTDFEPLMPRAAARCGRPFVSFDHQHFLTTYDLSGLSAGLRRRAWWMGQFVEAFYRGQSHSVVSSFYFPPLKPTADNVTQIGVLLRPSILQSQGEVGEHLLVYLRRFAAEQTLQTLRSCGREVHVYGLGERPSESNVRFFPINETRFVESLATCRALISNAGNQLVGEALYLRKPVLAFPETGNFEQAVNAHFLRECGGGDWLHEHEFAPASLESFLERTEDLRLRIDTTRVCGNADALAALRQHLPAETENPSRSVELVA